MAKLLIADTSELFACKVSTELENEYEIMRCNSGEQLLDMIRRFEPDVLLYDMLMSGINIKNVVRLLRCTGRKTRVVALAYAPGVFLEEQNTVSLLLRPCTVGEAVSCIRDEMFRAQNPNYADWCLENEVDALLLSLGFHMGLRRYNCVFEAILTRYHNPECSMKEMYIDVAKRCGGNYQRVEKAIRDAVENAYADGDKAVWNMYFQPNAKREKPHPGNEDFIARLAGALIQMTRIHKPCSEPRTGTIENRKKGSG